MASFNKSFIFSDIKPLAEAAVPKTPDNDFMALRNGFVSFLNFLCFGVLSSWHCLLLGPWLIVSSYTRNITKINVKIKDILTFEIAL